MTITAEQAMRDAIDSGLGAVDSCHVVRKSHGLSFPQIADLYHIVTTGKPTPEWAKSGTDDAVFDPNGDRAAWERGHQRRHVGEE